MTAKNKDDYIERVIKGGDDISSVLRRMTAPSLKNNEHIDVINDGMNGLAVIRIPEGYEALCFSASGDPDIISSEPYLLSMVERLGEGAKKAGKAWNTKVTPIGFANDINAGGSIDAELFGGLLNKSATELGVGVINGEFANLGDRVRVPFNINGVMVCMVEKGKIKEDVFTIDGTTYVKFDPKGKAVWINSDGQGTKAEFNERSGKYHLALYDSLAMKLDDLIKIGAEAKAVFDTVETREMRFGNFMRMQKEAERFTKKTGINYVLSRCEVGLRIKSYRSDIAAFNIGGSSVSTIDEERLKNPLVSLPGDFLLAMIGMPNPRSNGITDKRILMVEFFGKEWHKTPEGEIFMQYLMQPSTVFYPVFKELVDSGLANAVYHMSGGAYDGKLARPLAKQGLLGVLNDLFMPDWRELAIAGLGLNPAEYAYAKWPMGNEGFVSVIPDHIGEAESIIRKHGLKVRKAGYVEKAKKYVDPADNKTKLRTGLELTACNGEKVYFSGQKLS